MKRNYGIDLLRIVAMLFVVVLHITGVGGICSAAELGSPQFFLSQFLRMATYCSVNCYALISGFVGWNRTPKLSALLNLWVKVILFCVGITVFTRLRDPAAVELADLWKAFTPVNAASYWYFNAYVGLFFFIPLFNHGIRHISGREAVFALTGISLVLLSVQFSRIQDTFQLVGGYSALWLMILYLFGGLMARFDIPGKLRKRWWVLGYLLAVCASFLPRMAMVMLVPRLWSPENYNLSMRYVSPSVVLAAVALVGFFSRLELRETAVRVVKALSPHTFGVFLFHTHTLILLRTIRSRFGWLATAPVWKLVAVTAGVTALIFFVGIAADWLLSQGMKLAGINRLLKKLDGKRSAE